jgi:alpha-glucoside transport system permease protein
MGSKKNQALTNAIIVNGALLLLVLLWTIPTFGLFVSSFRDRIDIQTTGWWTIFPHREWVTTAEIDPREEGLDPDSVMDIRGVQGTFQEMREGLSDGSTRVIWIGNKRIGRIEVQEYQWTVNWGFTLANYQQVLGGKEFVYERPDGTVETVPGDNFWGSLWNSLAVSIPATIIPILIAAFAAYAFAWMSFPGRKYFFIMVIALLVVPLQIALVPILSDYTKLGLNGEFLGLWVGPHRLWIAVGHLSALQLHPRPATRNSGVCVYRRRVALYHLHPVDPAAVGAGTGLVCHFPVPVGLERLPGGLDHFGW